VPHIGALLLGEFRPLHHTTGAIRRHLLTKGDHHTTPGGECMHVPLAYPGRKDSGTTRDSVAVDRCVERQIQYSPSRTHQGRGLVKPE
jgi:hypothetical protein